MAEAVYSLCALTSFICAVLLFRGYFQRGGRLLFWCGLCFAGLGLNNILLFVDLSLLPNLVDLAVYRTLIALLSIGILVHSFIWEVE